MSKEVPKEVQPDALIHPTSVLTGEHPIRIASKVIIQPRTRLDSTYSTITIGPGTIIAERCTLGMITSSSTNSSAVAIGEGVVIETGANVEAAEVGDFSIVGVQARLGIGAKIGAKCKIGPGVTVRDGDHVLDHTVVWGDGWDQRRIERGGGGEREGIVKGMGDGLRAIWSNK